MASKLSKKLTSIISGTEEQLADACDEVPICDVQLEGPFVNWVAVSVVYASTGTSVRPQMVAQDCTDRELADLPGLSVLSLRFSQTTFLPSSWSIESPQRQQHGGLPISRALYR